MSNDNFIRLQVVERELVDIDNFLKQFKKRINANQFPIRVKINEGPDLNLLQCENKKFVDYLLQHTIASNIEIETDNLLESNNKIKVIKFFNHLPFLAYQNYNHKNKKFNKKFMHFVGNYRWPRFLISQWLHQQHNNDSVMTFWFTHNYLGQPPKQLLKYLTEKEITEHTQRLPLRVDTSETKEHAGYIDWKHTTPILPFYDTAFLDIVCETWHEGNTFMPTEKIARPLICKNPFIVYGPKNFLLNLKKLGFETFEGFWSEQYDKSEGIERIEQIKNLVNTFAEMPLNEIETLFQKLLPTLEHNRTIYNKLNHNKIMDVFG